MVSPRGSYIIEIIGNEIPAVVGTKVHHGFLRLRECHGKTYQEFRKLVGESVDRTHRPFSPSAVIKKAQKANFARLIPPILKSVYESPKSAKSSSREPESDAQDILFPYSKRNGLLANYSMIKFEIRGLNIWMPGIYAWDIHGIGVYIGRYTRARRPLGEYDKNVTRILRGEPYRPNKPHGFRRIHHALANAVKEQTPITLRIVENCLIENLDIRERHWLNEIGRGGLNG